MSVKVLKDIREELRELRLLYKELVEKLVSVEEPSEEERKGYRRKRINESPRQNKCSTLKEREK